MEEAWQQGDACPDMGPPGECPPLFSPVALPGNTYTRRMKVDHIGTSRNELFLIKKDAHLGEWGGGDSSMWWTSLHAISVLFSRIFKVLGVSVGLSQRGTHVLSSGRHYHS